VRFKFTNVGTEVQDFRINGKQTRLIQPGKTAKLTEASSRCANCTARRPLAAGPADPGLAGMERSHQPGGARSIGASHYGVS
jgi:hypothetical protein